MGCLKLDISDKSFTTLKVVHKSLEHSENTCTGAYLFGFNGKEFDSEWNGNPGAMYDYGFRIYDARIARFLSVDPLFREYPWMTPYAYAENSPIAFIDIEGLEKFDVQLLQSIGEAKITLRDINPEEGFVFNFVDPNTYSKILHARVLRRVKEFEYKETSIFKEGKFVRGGPALSLKPGQTYYTPEFELRLKYSFKEPKLKEVEGGTIWQGQETIEEIREVMTMKLQAGETKKVDYAKVFVPEELQSEFKEKFKELGYDIPIEFLKEPQKEKTSQVEVIFYQIEEEKNE